jgi:hemolysin III
MPPVPPPPPSALAAAAADAEAADLARMQRYFEWCDYYRVGPLPEATAAFRHSFVRSLRVTSGVVVLVSPRKGRDGTEGGGRRPTAQDLLPIMEMLKYDNVVSELDLGGCSWVGDAGAFSVASALPLCTNLRTLRMPGCGLTEAGAVPLLRAVGRCPSLQRLFLRGNRIGVVGAGELARVLRRTRALSYVDVSANFLTTLGVRKVAQALLERAQARLEKRARASKHVHIADHNGGGGGGGAGPGAAGVGASSAAAAAAAAAAATSSSSGRHILSGRLSGFGWMFAEASELVVTTNSVVRTNWSTVRDVMAEGGDGGQEQGPGGAVAALGPSALRGGAAGTVRPGAGEGSARRRRGSSASGVGGQAGGGAHGGEDAGWWGSNADVVPASPGQRSSSGTAGTESSSPDDAAHASSSSSHVDESVLLDIEVRIAGNFVREEMVNAAVHGVGLLLSLVGIFPLLARARASGDSGVVAGSVAYLVGLVSLFATSTLNHSLHMLDSHASFALLNHAAVFVLIAGTYTPFLLVNLRHVALGPALLIAVWALAFLGVVISTACGAGTGPSRRLRPLLYAGMGWLALIPFHLLRSCVDPAGWGALGGGGAAFTLGVLLYLRERRHADNSKSVIFAGWYVLVVLSCAAHYYAVYSFVAPPSAACVEEAAERGLLPWGWNAESAAAAVLGAVSSIAGTPGARGHGGAASAEAGTAAAAGSLGSSGGARGGGGAGLAAADAATMRDAATSLMTSLVTASATAAADGRAAVVGTMTAMMRQMAAQLEAVAALE